VAKVLGDQGIAQIAQQLGVSNEEAAGIRFGSAASVGALGEWCGRVACGNLKPALVATRGAPAWLGRAGRTRTDPKQPPLRTPGNRPAHERRRT
jgi:hypothetical protein